jgi:HPt (histidine-containing phosphotransfer) domain-containing protein
VVHKPFEMEDLLNQVQGILGGVGAEPGSSAEPEAGGEETVAVINGEQITRLLGDDIALIREVVAVTQEDLPENLAKLEREVAAGNAEAASKVAHTIKGEAANLGGERVQREALAMEQAGARGELATVKAQLPRLKEEVMRFLESLKDESNWSTE